MSKPKVFFVVGHSNWGKSKTLLALTGNSRYVRSIRIAATDFFLRRMSNDDRTRSYLKFIERLYPSTWPHVIAALCPQIDDMNAQTESILLELKTKGYRLYFWVIEHKYSGNGRVSAREISFLKQYGKVEVFGLPAEASRRATAFKRFVATHTAT